MRQTPHGRNINWSGLPAVGQIYDDGNSVADRATEFVRLTPLAERPAEVAGPTSSIAAEVTAMLGDRDKRIEDLTK
jgi:hypothetical protein